MPRFEIPDIRGETRDVAVSTSDMMAAIPVPATTAPVAETTSPAVGGGVKYARDDHAHPRLTSAKPAEVANGSGVITTIFTRTFATQPCPVLSVFNNPGAVAQVTAWTQDGGGLYTGASILVTRRTASTNTTGVTIVGITAIGTVSTTNADTPVAGAVVSVIMLAGS